MSSLGKASSYPESFFTFKIAQGAFAFYPIPEFADEP
jgi:hypothetical protein